MIYKSHYSYIDFYARMFSFATVIIFVLMYSFYTKQMKNLMHTKLENFLHFFSNLEQAYK